MAMMIAALGRRRLLQKAVGKLVFESLMHVGCCASSSV